MAQTLLMRFLRALEDRRHQSLIDRATPCTRDACAHVRVGVIHYHWGWGQRHTSMTPVTGPGSFSDGEPYIRTTQRGK